MFVFNKLQIKFASLYEEVKGFSQNICFLFFIANLIIFLCKIGGMAIATASICLSNINSILIGLLEQILKI